jgi:membrane protease YdiL (CAAX protease family)
MDQHTVSRPRVWAGRHRVGLYLLLAFGLSWSIWPLVLANPESSPLVPFGPALAAVLVCAWAGGRHEVARLLGSLTRWVVHPGWYAAALLVPGVAAGGAAAVSVLLGAPAPSLTLADLPQLVAAVAATFVIVGLFEELGWRAFLLPELRGRRTALHAALLVGLVWVPWHLPELVSDPSQRPLIQFGVLLMSQSVIFAWLYLSTGGSLPVVMLAHAAYNSFARFLLADLPGEHYTRAWWVMSGLSLLIAAAVIWYGGAGLDSSHTGRSHGRRGTSPPTQERRTEPSDDPS